MPEEPGRAHPAETVRVAVVDDHRLFAAALAVALGDAGLEAETYWTDSCPSLLASVLQRSPAVVVVDRVLGPLGTGEALIAPLAAAGTAVVVVSATVDDVISGRCLSMGAAACLSKSEPFDTLLTTVLRVARGDRALPDALRFELIEKWRSWQVEDDVTRAPFRALTARESLVLGQLMAGRSVQWIARDSYVSEGTVRTQVRSILSKLGVNKQLEAVALAVHAGWSPPAIAEDPARRSAECPLR